MTAGRAVMLYSSAELFADIVALGVLVIVEFTCARADENKSASAEKRDV
jgi:hypothetical protein